MRTVALALAAVVLATSAVRAGPGDVVRPVAAAPGEAVSQVFRVTVNGQAVPVVVYEAGRAPGWGASDTPRRLAIAQFSFAGRADIAVRMDRPVPAGWRLGPASLGLKPVVSGDTLTFPLRRPAKMMLHWGGWYGLPQDGGAPERLILIADTLEGDPPGPGAIDVTQRGADPTGAAPASAAIQAAVDAAGPGGTVLVPPGRYALDQPIAMRPAVRLHLAAGALLIALNKMPGGDSGVITMDGAPGAQLTGRGTVDYRGSDRRRDSAAAPDFDHPTMVLVKNSDGAVVRDVQLRDSANIHVYVAKSNDVRVTGVKLITDADYPNTDGIDPNDGAQRTYVDDVFVHNTDDSFAGGTGDSFADWSVSNAVVMHTHNGGITKAFGFNWNTSFDRFSFENIDSMHSWQPIAVLTGPNGAHVADYWVKSLRVEVNEINTITAIVGTDACEPLRFGLIRRIRLVDVRFGSRGTPFFTECQRSALLGAPADADGPHDIADVFFRGVRMGTRWIARDADLDWAGVRRNEHVVGLSYLTALPPQVNATVTSLYASPGRPSAFVIARSRGTNEAPMTVRYRVQGSARPGVDYTALSGVATIPAGAASVSVPVVPLGGAGGEVRSVAIVLQPLPQSADYVLGPQAQRQIALVPMP